MDDKFDFEKEFYDKVLMLKMHEGWGAEKASEQAKIATNERREYFKETK